MKVYDISLPLSATLPVWPGDPPFELNQVSSMSHGDTANVSQISMSVHCGTHIDAPKHFINSGKTVDQIPIEKLLGDVLVIKIDDAENVISEEVLQAHPQRDLIKHATKVLFSTKNSHLWRRRQHKFEENYVGINASGAQYLERLNFDLIGIDYLSIAPYDDTLTPHNILLAGETVLLEGLNLSGVPAGVYEICCLPLKISGCEGAPARVILIEH